MKHDHSTSKFRIDRERLESHILMATRHCLHTQDNRGAWQIHPNPRLFDTGLVAYSLAQVPDCATKAAVERARIWMREHCTPQNHNMLAHKLDETPYQLLTGVLKRIDLNDVSYFADVYRRKVVLLYILALHAGIKADIPFPENHIFDQISKYYEARNSIQLKQWGKVDLLSIYLLFQTLKNHRKMVEEIYDQLKDLQASDGSFCYNPISTAMGFLALCAAAPGSVSWERCLTHLLKSQQPDGTWRFCISNIWDTTLMVRTFKNVPLFKANALKPAVNFIRQNQNPDGGWGFRNQVESDSDTSSCALLAMETNPQDPIIQRGIDYFERFQTREGLWRTWQSDEDSPVEDVVAHVVTALEPYQNRHKISLIQARDWIATQYQKKGRWLAGWYRNLPYAVLEVGQALGQHHPITLAATSALQNLQNVDGGWGGEPGDPSLASATGLAVAALLQIHDTTEPCVHRGVQFLMKTQQKDGAWRGRPEMFSPRPLLCHMPTNTHAFASHGLIAAWRQLNKRG